MKNFFAKLLVWTLDGMTFTVGRQPRKLSIEVLIDHRACPEVKARGTHWPLKPGYPCAGCGTVAPG